MIVLPGVVSSFTAAKKPGRTNSGHTLDWKRAVPAVPLGNDQHAIREHRLQRIGIGCTEAQVMVPAPPFGVFETA